MSRDGVSPENELRQSMQRIDRSRALDHDAARRIEARMLARFDQVGAGEVRTNPADIVPVVDPTTDGGSTDGPRRGPVWWARAAVVVVIASAAIATSLWIGGSNRDTRAPSDTAAAPITSPEPTSTQSSVPPVSVLEDGENAFGHRAFTTYNYLASDESVGPGVPSALSDRVGDVDLEAARPTMNVRRAIADASPESFELEILGDVVIVPLDWLDPAFIGGTCVGGNTVVGPSMPARAEVSAICDGIEVDVTVTATPGDAVVLPRDDAAAITATPLQITMMPDGTAGAKRSVTLWFSTDGLVRRTHTIDGTSVDYDLDVSSNNLLGPT